MKKIVLIFICLFTALPTWGEQTIYHIKGSPLALGRNIDINFPFERKEKCLEESDTRWAHVDSGAREMKFSSDLIKETETLSKLLSFDLTLMAKAKFDLLGGQLDLSSKILKNFESYSDSLSYLLQASYDFGEKELSSTQLKPYYQKLLEDKKYQEFIKRCGTHFVLSTQQAAMVNVLVKVKNLNHNEKKRLELTLGGSASYGPLEGSLKSQLVKNYELSKKYGRTSLNVEALGGKSDYFNGFGSSDNLEKTLEALERFMGSITRESSVPKAYHLISFERFGLVESPSDDLKDVFLRKAFDVTLQFENHLRRLDGEIQELRFMPPEQIHESLSYLQRTQYELLKQKEDVDRIIEKCLEQSLCDPGLLNKIDFNISWTSDFLKKAGLELYCYKDRDIVQFQSFIRGEWLYPDLIKLAKFYRVNSSGQRKLVKVGMSDLATHGARFSGVVDQDHLSLRTEDMNELTKLNYILEIINHQDRAEQYHISVDHYYQCF